MRYFLARFTEASSHGGIAAVLLATQQIMDKNYAVGVPALVTGLAAFFIPAKGATV